MTLKQKVHAQYVVILQDKIDVFRDRITALTEDSKNDAKGSAGDKHETALSMMHLEQEKTSYKLKEFLDQKAVLDRIDVNIVSKKIALGSLVKTNNVTVYLSVALPKIIEDSQSIFAISTNSPLGLHLMGREIGFEFQINGITYNIIDVL